ncbi:uncharacterized protein LOC119674110 [Teleopsis dalmanni]|uniref:uncharacterized protein LOC119674110 n=1 Tax=Teleopsis dalmanni TaxID=139649 RepID=UPI0018CC8452|nr:uncharacterized protein LOC119674110 [Teleopsis dalmanni]
MEIMTPQHVAEILCNYDSDIRMRFQQNYIKWRNQINKPYNALFLKYINFHSIETRFISKQLNPNYYQRNNYELEKVGVLSNPEKNKAVSPVIKLINDATMLTTDSSFKSLLEEMPEVISRQEFKRRQSIPTVRGKVGNCTDPNSFSVLAILQSNGDKGLEILKYYDEFKTLTWKLRKILVNLIVKYFIKLDLHISLKLSYNLEKQILKIFPTEKLKNYRTIKRGKIYTKFCHMNRSKRKDIKV